VKKDTKGQEILGADSFSSILLITAWSIFEVLCQHFARVQRRR